jgi:acyl-CoA synthetase (AMP-forming)/AMP-acid ligase II
LDATGAPAAAGEVGHVQVRGPLVLGAAADGWLDTGDLGRFDAHGRLHVCGRADEMFVSGGENVYAHPTEVELAAHPQILEAAISVVPDDEFGQSMLAWVVPARGGPTEAALRDWLRGRLERHQLPRRIHVVGAIPRNALGKVDRQALAALAADAGKAA